jgi:antitoxin VapB
MAMSPRRSTRQRPRRTTGIARSLPIAALFAPRISARRRSPRSRPARRNPDSSIEPDQPGTSLVELGLDFCRKLRADGHTAEGKPADKAFRDGLFDDS